MRTVEEARTRWQGVLAPLVTPFLESGRVDISSLQHNVQWLMDRGARPGNTVLLAAGSGGDFPMMSLDERLEVIRAIAEVNQGYLPIIAGAQSLDLRETITLCEFCESLDLDAVQISGPFYYDGRPGDVVAWIDEVARHTKVGFAIYNNWYTGYDMPLSLIEQLLSFPNTIGVKWASPNMDVFEDGVRRLGPHAAVVNNTLFTVWGHLLGLKCFVSHWPNFHPEFCWQVWDLMEAGRYTDAQRLFDTVMVPYRELINAIAGQTAGEAVYVRPFMDIVGLRGGVSRLPSRDIAVHHDLRHHMEELLESAKSLAALQAATG